MNTAGGISAPPQPGLAPRPLPARYVLAVEGRALRYDLGGARRARGKYSRVVVVAAAAAAAAIIEPSRRANCVGVQALITRSRGLAAAACGR